MPDATSPPILIVGAGLAGLCCAKHLGEAGRDTVLLDAADAPGGRVRTDRHPDGFLLDRGFQIFLDSYPEAAAVLDLEALNLQPFEPGALTRLHGVDRWLPIVDPFRRPSRAVAVALSPAATFKDKWLVAKLRRDVHRGDLERLLADAEQRSTLDFLRGYGFSDTIIETFFRPFFGGVFLDRSLSTGARLFRWLFRLFSVGNACLPAAGIEAIPRQVAARLKRCDQRMNTRVRSVGDDGSVVLENGERLEGAAVVVATEATAAAALLGDRLPGERRPMRRTATLYFAAVAPVVADNLLLLGGGDAKAASPVNTIAQLSVAAPSYAPEGQHLLSVSVVDVPDKGEVDAAKLLDDVRRGLGVLVGSDAATALRHLRTYVVDDALPSQPPPALADVHKPAKLADKLFVCGDHLDTASLNGAMLSGRRAAEAVLATVPAEG